MYNIKNSIKTLLEKVAIYMHGYSNLSKNYIPVPADGGLYYRDGILFNIDNMLVLTLTAYNDYNSIDILPTDIVLDIGACTGGFSLQAAKKAKHVFSVEPFYIEALRKNIELNKLSNITLIESALGLKNQKCEFGKPSKMVEFGKCLKVVDFISFQEILNLCGGHVDFLKIDCEGGEWTLTSNDLKGIRRIEAEIHEIGGYKIKDFLKLLDDAGFKYTVNKPIIHATC
jgi:FkbM family methyltransferase